MVFDFGRRHIGVATAERRLGLAQGVATVAARAGKPHWDALDMLVGEWRPDVLVVGLPLNMDGSYSDMCVEARRFGVRLAARYRCSVEYADERLSTFEARARGAAPNNTHRLAAQTIAETWLQSGAAAVARADAAL